MVASRAEDRVGKREFGANTYTAIVCWLCDGWVRVGSPEGRWRFGQAARWRRWVRGAGCFTMYRGVCCGRCLACECGGSWKAGSVLWVEEGELFK
jgi:hypothetical protein